MAKKKKEKYQKHSIYKEYGMTHEVTRRVFRELKKVVKQLFTDFIGKDSYYEYGRDKYFDTINDFIHGLQEKSGAQHDIEITVGILINSSRIKRSRTYQRELKQKHSYNIYERMKDIKKLFNDFTFTKMDKRSVKSDVHGLLDTVLKGTSEDKFTNSEELELLKQFRVCLATELEHLQ